jgi:hypothetical protein
MNERRVILNGGTELVGKLDQITRTGFMLNCGAAQPVMLDFSVVQEIQFRK